ncbi:hypothetical protein PAXRUDRAFT_153654, partial [Paxillus rubicundulus Ve08.2h10]
GELEHQQVKHFYARMNKIKFTCGIVKQQQCKRLLHQLWETKQQQEAEAIAAQQGMPVGSLDTVKLKQEQLPHCSPNAHYQVSLSQKHYWDISSWLRENRDDPVVSNTFLSCLKSHILAHLSGKEYDSNESTFSAREWNSVIFLQNQIYCHKVLCVNYTTYDLCHAQDLLNPHTHADVMVLVHEDKNPHPHPYWYACIIGIFHVNITQFRMRKQLDILWIRWFACNVETPTIWALK